MDYSPRGGGAGRRIMTAKLVNNLTIGVRLSIGFGIVFVLFCALTIFAINRMEYLADNTRQIYNHPLTVSNAVLRINAHIIKMHRSMKDIALDETLAQINNDSRLVDGFEKEVYADFDIINKWFLGDRTLFEAARKVFVSWKPIRDGNYSAPLGFCSLARRRMRRIRSIWVICEDSSIAATPLEGKRRGVLSSYPG